MLILKNTSNLQFIQTRKIKKKFYKILNNIVKFKVKEKIVADI